MSETSGMLPEGWHLDKRVPLALIFTALAQVGALVWFAAGLSGRVDGLDRRTAVLEAREETERKAAHELARDIGEIKAQLKILLDRLPK